MFTKKRKEDLPSAFYSCLSLINKEKSVSDGMQASQNGIVSLLGTYVLYQDPSGTRQSRSVEFSKRWTGSYDGTKCVRQKYFILY